MHVPLAAVAQFGRSRRAGASVTYAEYAHTGIMVDTHALTVNDHTIVVESAGSGARPLAPTSAGTDLLVLGASRANHRTVIWTMKRIVGRTPGAGGRELLLAILVVAALMSIVGTLENTIARAPVLAHGNVIDHDVLFLDDQQKSLPPHWANLVPLQEGWKRNVELLERALVERALASANGNKSRAADTLGIHRRLLYEKIRQYRLNSKEHAAGE